MQLQLAGAESPANHIPTPRSGMQARASTPARPLFGQCMKRERALLSHLGSNTPGVMHHPWQFPFLSVFISGGSDACALLLDSWGDLIPSCLSVPALSGCRTRAPMGPAISRFLSVTASHAPAQLPSCLACTPGNNFRLPSLPLALLLGKSEQQKMAT